VRRDPGVDRSGDEEVAREALGPNELVAEGAVDRTDTARFVVRAIDPERDEGAGVDGEARPSADVPRPRRQLDRRDEVIARVPSNVPSTIRCRSRRLFWCGGQLSTTANAGGVP
jgi:hypothetical protein